MASEPSSARSRRAILATAAGGVAVAIADSLARPRHVAADTGGNVILGQPNTAGSETKISCDQSNGVSGSSAAFNASGVYGENTAAGFGTYGRSNNFGGGTGVFGEGFFGVGVQGHSQQGTGIKAITASGTAFEAQGRVKFSTAGLTSVAVGANQATVTPGVDLVTGSMILCTLESNQTAISIQRVTKNTMTNTFKVFLSKTVAAGKTAKIAWFVIG
jgi:hypothetical protein